MRFLKRTLIAIAGAGIIFALIVFAGMLPQMLIITDIFTLIIGIICILVFGATIYLCLCIK